MLTVGDAFPELRLRAIVGNDAHRDVVELTHLDYPGLWKVWFAWPNDFTQVCPTEIVAFAQRHADFVERDAQVLGFSVDSIHAHRAWRHQNPDLKDLPYPMVSDPARKLATALGILHPEEGVAMRATFVVDPDNRIRWACCSDLAIGRNVDEVLRVLSALQSGGLCACGWEPGDALLDASD